MLIYTIHTYNIINNIQSLNELFSLKFNILILTLGLGSLMSDPVHTFEVALINSIDDVI